MASQIHAQSTVKFRVFARLLALNGAIFVVGYGFANYYASGIDNRYALYFPWEKYLPLYESWIVVYLSIFIWFMLPVLLLQTDAIKKLSRCFTLTTLIACGFFFVLPAQSPFVRIESDRGISVAYQVLYALDKPHNLFPSLHIAYTYLLLLVYRRESVRALPWLYLWAAAMTASVILTHQHNTVDIVGGIVLAAIVYRYYYFAPASPVA